MRSASDSAETRAPTPDAPISKPSVAGPPCSTWEAKIGINTTNGMPIRLTSAKSSRMVRTGAKPETYAQPSFNCSHMEERPRAFAATA